MRVDRPAQIPSPAVPTSVQRLRMLALIVGYIALVLIAWRTGSDILSALCVVVLVSAVLASRLKSNAAGARLLWLALIGAVVALTAFGHGRLTLDLVPLAINLALAFLFGHSLTGSHTPLIARAIVAIEGRERLLLPRVAGYARALTLAWTLVFLAQAGLFVLLLGWWLPTLRASGAAHSWMQTYAHVGGYLLPALFMLAEYAFRRWYLRHLPHVAPRIFLERLLRNWPQLLRDADTESEARDGR